MRDIHETAQIAPGVELPRSVQIGPFSIVNSGVQLGDRVVIGANCIIGKPPRRGRNQLPLGLTEERVCIGADTIIGDFVSIYNEVEIGDNCFIADRATMREQSRIEDDVVVGLAVVISYRVRIGRGTKIMTQSNIGGEFVIGEDCFIGLQVCMFNDRQPMESKTNRCELPKSVIGDRVMIGSNSSIFPGLEIVSDVIVGVGALVNKSLNEPGTYIGAPTRKHR